MKCGQVWIHNRAEFSEVGAVAHVKIRHLTPYVIQDISAYEPLSVSLVQDHLFAVNIFGCSGNEIRRIIGKDNLRSVRDILFTFHPEVWLLTSVEEFTGGAYCYATGGSFAYIGKFDSSSDCVPIRKSSSVNHHFGENNPSPFIILGLGDRLIQRFLGLVQLLGRDSLSIPLAFLSQQNAALRCVGGFLSCSSLPRANPGAKYSENYESDLSPKYSPLQRKFFLLMGLLGFLTCSFIGIFILRRGGENRNSSLIVNGLLFVVVVLCGQGSVFLLMRGLCGR